jgi:hypothetical protein
VVNREGEGQIWWMHFVFVYELVEIVLRLGRSKRENDGERESN